MTFMNVPSIRLRTDVLGRRLGVQATCLRTGAAAGLRASHSWALAQLSA